MITCHPALWNLEFFIFSGDRVRFIYDYISSYQYVSDVVGELNKKKDVFIFITERLEMYQTHNHLIHSVTDGLSCRVSNYQY